MDKQHGKRVRRTQRRAKGEKHLDSFSATHTHTHKKVPNLKIPAHNGMHDIKNSIPSMTDWLSK